VTAQFATPAESEVGHIRPWQATVARPSETAAPHPPDIGHGTSGWRVAAVGFALATGLSTAAVVHLLRTPNPLVDLRILRIHTYRVTAGPARCSGPSSPRSRS
jgi:hypothetical protein